MERSIASSRLGTIQSLDCGAKWVMCTSCTVARNRASRLYEKKNADGRRASERGVVFGALAVVAHVPRAPGGRVKYFVYGTVYLRSFLSVSMPTNQFIQTIMTHHNCFREYLTKNRPIIHKLVLF